jgi:ankyrin
LPSDLQKRVESGDGKELMKWISKSKDGPDSIDGMGLTPLHYAAYFGKKEMVRDLLKLGADPDFKIAKYNSTPLQWATYCGIKNAPKLNCRMNAEVIGALIVGGATYDIMSAMANQDLRHVKSLLKKNPEEVNSKWMNGFAPLHVNNGFEIGKLLIKLGADVDQRSEDGTTPLIYLCNRLKAEPAVAMLYIQNGAHINAQNKAGSTALHGAVRRGHEEIVEALLKSGARKGLKNKKGETPLDKAENLGKKPLQVILKRK